MPFNRGLEMHFTFMPSFHFHGGGAFLRDSSTGVYDERFMIFYCPYFPSPLSFVQIVPVEE